MHGIPNIASGRKKRFHIGQTFEQPEGKKGDLVIQRADSRCKDREAETAPDVRGQLPARSSV